MRTRTVNVIRWAAYGAAAVYAFRYLGLALHRGPNPDELQSLTNGFDSSRGLRLYLDFWDNHGPALTWLLRPLVAIWPDDHNVFFVARSCIWGCAMLSAVLVYKLAGAVFPGRSALQAISPMLFLMSTPIMASGIEIRPDNFVVPMWAGCMLCLVHGLRTSRWRWWLLAGLLLGGCACFTIKVLPLGACVMLMAGGAALARIWKANAKCTSVAFAAVAVGFAVPLGIMLSVMWSAGQLEAWYLCVIRANIEREKSVGLSPFTELFEGAPFWIFLSIASCGVALWRAVRRRAGTELMLACPAAFLIFQFAFLLPTKFLSSLLSAQVPQAVLNAWLLCELAMWVEVKSGGLWRWVTTAGMPRRIGMAVLVGLIGWAGHWEYRREEDRYGKFYSKEANEFVDFANRIAGHVGQREFVFDPGGFAFLRAKPGLFHILVTFLRELHAEGSLHLNIPEALSRNNCKYVVYDTRVNALPYADTTYIRTHYVPVDGVVLNKLPVLLAAAGQNTARTGKVKATVSGRYVARWKERGGWAHEAIGWVKAGTELQLRDFIWAVLYTSKHGFKPNQFADWKAFKEPRRDNGAATVTTPPKWLVKYLLIAGREKAL